MCKIENVQSRATKFILNDYHSDYKYRLNVGNVIPLSPRRDFLDVIFLYNFLNDLVDVKLNIVYLTHDDRTRSANDNL